MLLVLVLASSNGITLGWPRNVLSVSISRLASVRRSPVPAMICSGTGHVHVHMSTDVSAFAKHMTSTETDHNDFHNCSVCPCIMYALLLQLGIKEAALYQCVCTCTAPQHGHTRRSHLLDSIQCLCIHKRGVRGGHLPNQVDIRIPAAANLHKKRVWCKGMVLQARHVHSSNPAERQTASCLQFAQYGTARMEGDSVCKYWLAMHMHCMTLNACA